jgi:hypothetical protein
VARGRRHRGLPHRERHHRDRGEGLMDRRSSRLIAIAGLVVIVGLIAVAWFLS